MGDILIVTTCPRKESYLGETIKSLEKSGAASFPRKIILNDSIDRQGYYFPDWLVNSHVGPSGTKIATWRAFRLAANENRLLLAQDDIKVCRNALYYINTVDIPSDCPFVTFFDFKELRYKKHLPGTVVRVPITGYDGRGLWGLQLIMFNPIAVRQLLKHDPAKESQEKNMADSYISEVLQREGWDYFGVHTPCLAQHVGKISAAHDEKLVEQSGPRDSLMYVGDDFDALTLGG